MNRLLICKSTEASSRDEQNSSRNLSENGRILATEAAAGNDSTSVGIQSKLKPIHRNVKMRRGPYLAVYVPLSHICRLKFLLRYPLPPLPYDSHK